MDFKLEPSGDSGVLTMDGEMTIQRADELRTALMSSLESADNMFIDLKQVTEVDLACLQLLCSAHQTSVRLNKKLTLNSADSQVFKQIVRDAGYPAIGVAL